MQDYSHNIISLSHHLIVEEAGILHPKTLSRAFAERNDILSQLRRVGLQPAFRGERAWVGEEGGVVVHEEGAHSYGCLGGSVS